MDLRQIDCFLAVATDLHFGKAAKTLSLAQSSVSEAINSLEKEVGGQLFVRTSRWVQLTPLGEKFRLGVEPATLVLRATLDDCRKTALGQTSRLRIGFLGGGLYEYTLPFVSLLSATCCHFLRKIPSDHSRNDGRRGEPPRRCGSGTPGLCQIVAICPGHSLDHADIEQSAELPR